MLDFSNPAVWWYITRSSAIVAWVLLTGSALLGILLKTRILRGADNPEWLKSVHRYVSSLAMLMVATHVVSLYLDEFVDFSILDLLVPFHSTYQPLGVAIGVIGMWAMLLTWATALAMNWLPQPMWKGIHYLSYLSLFAVAIHAGMVGTDVGEIWYFGLSIVLVTATALAAVVRIMLARRTSAPARLAPATPVAETPSVPSAHSTERFVARVVTRTEVARDVAEFVFSPVDSSVELEWDAGAHITIHLPNGLERQYSLCGDPADNTSPRIAVLNTRGEGGGSQWIHENLRPGMEFEVDYPLQTFPLRAHKKYQFIASGIGITPIKAMIATIPAQREWELIYIGRHREDMAYRDELAQFCGDHLFTYVTSERGKRISLPDVIDPTAHIYACGSEALMEQLEQIVPAERLHIERFTPRDRSAEHSATALTVTWEPTGQTVSVPAETPVLDAMEQQGIPVTGSCRRGVCGSCELRVVDGVPAHLDSVMSDEDKDEIGAFYPCVSRAQGDAIRLSY